MVFGLFELEYSWLVKFFSLCACVSVGRMIRGSEDCWGWGSARSRFYWESRSRVRVGREKEKAEKVEKNLQIPSLVLSLAPIGMMWAIQIH